MVSLTQRLSILTLMFVLTVIAITESSANPGQEQHDVNSVADAIRYLQDLENRHQFARPRSRSTDIDGIPINAHHAKMHALLSAILDQIDQTHSRTPRFGKRGNDFMTKEFTNNYLRYLLENPPEQAAQIPER